MCVRVCVLANTHTHTLFPGPFKRERVRAACVKVACQRAAAAAAAA